MPITYATSCEKQPKLNCGQPEVGFASRIQILDRLKTYDQTQKPQ